MLSKLGSRISTGWWIGILAVLWLGFISGMHFWLNFDRDTRKLVHIGYMPVVTNLAAPLLDSACDPGRKVRYEALKFSSFAEMGEALRNRHIQAAFIIAPLSIVLHQQGAGIKMCTSATVTKAHWSAGKTCKPKHFGILPGNP